MRLPDLLSGSRSELLATATDLFGGHVTRTVRLGVTGLSRAGKTVLITALVRCLTEPGLAHPPLTAQRRLAGFRAYLEPQPNDDLPRFAYEQHLEALTGADRHWPDGTRRISQLRVTIEWNGETGASSALGLTQRLHVDIVDYPGEWLLDLSLMDLSFEAWAQTTLQRLRTTHAAEAETFLTFYDGLFAGHDTSSPAAIDEPMAIEGARLFTKALHSIRNNTETQAVMGPGRFLLPGDLDGAPLVTFFPAAVSGRGDTEGGNTTDTADALPGTELLRQRYDAYKRRVVEPFFRDHFAKLDRQIVLVDALTPLNRGAGALVELERALEDALQAFRPGRNTWASFLSGRRIGRVLFAATKADHIHAASHSRLTAILEKAVLRAARRAGGAGADIGFHTLAALSATENIDARSGDEAYHCIRGVPIGGEVVSGRTYDGTTAAVVFPGDLPRDPLDAFDADHSAERDYAFVRFRPPEQGSADHPPDGNPRHRWPHIGLDHVVQFLLGDELQ